MRASAILFRVLRLFVPLSIFATVYIYLYPLFKQCSFVTPVTSEQRCLERNGRACVGGHANPLHAPFRLLALGDPQLEGDSSLPENLSNPFDTIKSAWNDVVRSDSWLEAAQHFATALQSIATNDVPSHLLAWRKEVDLFGNDYYLAHIYRTLHWWTGPTHVAVLGDLLGSQWVSDDEFKIRGSRYWDRVFRNGMMVGEDITAREDGSEVLGRDALWEDRIINIAGNHDIGYAGDIDESRVSRFENLFGRVNWDIKFHLPNESLTANLNDQPPHNSADPPTLHLIILNTMNFDGPVRSEALQASTYDFVNDVIARLRPVEEHSSATVLLTHIPLHKSAGVCVDPPMVQYFPHYDGGGVKEQNHLSEWASRQLLEGLYGFSANREAPNQGMGRNGVIVNGHDHEGCDTWHSIEHDGLQWNASRYEEAKFDISRHQRPGIREITLRSMMGEYGGYAGLLSAWFDEGSREWVFDFETCSLGIQHWWWAAHIVDLITLLLLIAAIATRALEELVAHRQVSEGERQIKKGIIKRD